MAGTPNSYNIRDILGGPNMRGLIYASVSGIEDPFDPAYYSTSETERSVDPVRRDYANYMRVTGQRTPSTLSVYGGSSKNIPLKSLGEKTVKLMTSIENIVLPASDLVNLTNYTNPQIQNKGIMEVKRQVADFKKRFRNLQIASMTAAIFWGSFSFDKNGNFYDPSQATPTGGTNVGFNIPNGTTGEAIPDTTIIPTNISTTFGANTGLIPTGVGSAIIGNSTVGDWAFGTTNIPQQLINMRRDAIRATGYKPTTIYYGSNIPIWMTQNGFVQSYLARNPALNQKYLDSGEIPDGVLGWKWRKAYDACYRNSTNDNVNLVGNNQIAIVPDPDPSWVGWLDGSTIIPDGSSLGRTFNPDDVMAGGGIEAWGMYAYGVVQEDPFGAKIVAGMVGLPAIKNPLVVYSTLVSGTNP